MLSMCALTLGSAKVSNREKMFLCIVSNAALFVSESFLGRY